MKRQKTNQRFVAYYRVSTNKQSSEMPAQKTAVKNYLKAFWPPEKSFTEIESGKKSDRPELKKALEYCQKNNAVLVVAKLDRLSRDLEFIGWIQNTDIKFVCCDMPQATRETIGFMGVMARWEREQIAKRTKEALAEKRKQGVKLGSNNPKVKAGLKVYWKGKAQKRAKEDKLKAFERKKAKIERDYLKSKKLPIRKTNARKEADKAILPVIKTLKAEGYSFEKIAQSLNSQGYQTRRGYEWSKMQVFIVAKRNGLK